MLRYFEGKNDFRSMVGIGGAATLGQLSSFVIAPILSRLYTENDFGQFGLFFSISNVLVPLSLLGLQDALLAANRERDAKALLFAAVLLVLLSGPVVWAVAYGLINFSLLGYGGLPRWTAILIVVEVIAICAVAIIQMFLIRRTMFDQLALGYLTQGVMRAGSQIGFGACGLGFLGLGLSDALTRAMVAIVMARKIWRELLDAINTPLRVCVRAVWDFRLFVLFRTPSTLIFNLGTGLPPILITMAYGVSEAGLYTFMFSVVTAPIGLVQKAIGEVFLGNFANRFKSDPASARKYLQYNAVMLFLLSVPLGMILVLWGTELFSFVFGTRWREAGHLASLMVPLFMASIIVGPLGGALNIVNRPDAKLIFDVARIGGFCAAYAITTATGAPLPVMIKLFAWLGTFSYAVYFGLIVFGIFNPRQRKETIEPSLFPEHFTT